MDSPRENGLYADKLDFTWHNISRTTGAHLATPVCWSASTSVERLVMFPTVSAILAGLSHNVLALATRYFAASPGPGGRHSCSDSGFRAVAWARRRCGDGLRQNLDLRRPDRHVLDPGPTRIPYAISAGCPYDFVVRLALQFATCVVTSAVLPVSPRSELTSSAWAIGAASGAPPSHDWYRSRASMLLLAFNCPHSTSTCAVYPNANCEVRP